MTSGQLGTGELTSAVRVEDPDTRAHGANESLHLAAFERACLAEALLLRNLAP
jgi:hypothetical protein